MSRGDGNEDDEPLPNPDDDNSAAVQYMKEFNARTKEYSNYDAVANYTPQILSEIDPKVGEVAEFGANAYLLFKAYTTNNWSAGFEGSIGVLKMFGLFKGGSGGVSNAQILSEVQRVGLEVSDVHGLAKAMNSKLDKTLRQAYANNLQPFDNAVNALNRLEQLDAGQSPEQVRAAASGGGGFRLHVNTFGRTITSIGYATNVQGNSVPTGLLEEYITRLHGKGLGADLDLAGLWVGRLEATDNNGVTTAINQQWYGDASVYTNGAHGIGFNGTYKDDWYKADIIGYDKMLHREEPTLSKKGKKLSNPFDKPWSTEWAYSMPYMVFQFD